jgi:hypothetical protein
MEVELVEESCYNLDFTYTWAEIAIIELIKTFFINRGYFHVTLYVVQQEVLRYNRYY